MSDSAYKLKYQKYKIRVKTWEKDFKRKFSRIPSKYDIREAPQEIRDAYKMYYKLKTSFLEDTLNDVLDDDGFNVLEISQDGGNSTGKDHNASTEMSSSIAALLGGNTGPSILSELNKCEEPAPQIAKKGVRYSDFEEKVVKEFDAAEFCETNEKAWGPEVSKKPLKKGEEKCPQEAGSIRKHFLSNLSAKLFKSTSFSKRNPRKSLSRSNSEANSQLLRQESAPSICSEVLPDLETILLQKAKEQQASVAVTANPLLAGKDMSSQMQVDSGWLNRNTIDESIKGVVVTATKSAPPIGAALLDSSKVEKRYGLSNINVTTLIPLNSVNQTKNEDKPKEKAPDQKPGSTTKIATEISVVASMDSDSVVSDSAGEEEEQIYVHATKRRKVLKTIEKTQEISNLLAKDKDLINFKQTAVEDTASLSENRQEANTYDFTASDIEDADYSPPKNAKAKRTQTKTTKKRFKSQQSEQEKSSSRTKPKLRKNAKRPANSQKLTPGRASKSKAAESKAISDVIATNVEASSEELVEKPPEAATLRYNMLLERGDLTCTPRVANSELEQVDDVAQQYINCINVSSALAQKSASKAKPSLAPIIDEKRAAARKKLEAKIAAGKLNENYVSINLQKKIFARGKRHMNYSKYKKKQWRHKKKIAALAGPDMDMGGCDGGVLTCFTCGQVGHFAAQCKIKGDSLLPLSAQLEEDPSPFPTLEEVERMAAENKVVVHSRNILKLPAVPNTALYQDSEDGEEKQENTNEQDGEVDEKTIGSGQSDDNSVDDYESENKMGFESDEELENINLEQLSTPVHQVSPIRKYVGHQIPEDFLKKVGLHATSGNEKMLGSKFGDVIPLYELDSEGNVRSDVPSEVTDALRMFGHTNFRKGQDRAIMRILSGLSTLVTLSTGSGKSLCYQLPAYLYSHRRQAITLVISPLVSLMEDQVTGVPHFLRAHCLHTNQTPQQRLKVMEKISAGEVDILLVSPEAVVAGERSTGFGAILRQLPPIAFACIDEAHCVSQWSHNFRPSYLMICKVLRQNLGINTVLGLTATATLPTRLSIITHLGITDGLRGVISDIPLPDNLLLSVSKDENKDAALVALLTSDRFTDCQSIIVYCTRRDECERIASHLRTYMQDQCNEKTAPDGGKRKRKRVNWAAEPYHAGMPPSRRRTIQNAFMRNDLRIVVATIAFGMGINKPDLRAVIHYNMPRNYESYVQEIGRAGRDGKPAHCHLFLDARGGDKCELRRHIYANSIDRHVIRKLLQHVFVPCACAKKGQPEKQYQRIQGSKNELPIEAEAHVSNRICPGHEIGFSVERTVEELDIPEENISTLLCYLELDSRWNISVLSNAYTMAKVISYGGAKYLKHAAKECPPLAMAIALEIKQNKFKDDSNIIEFSVVDIAAAIGWNSGVVKYQLKNLEWTEVNGYPRRSPINVNFYDIGFRLKAPGDFIPEEIDDALDTLYNRTVEQERTQLIQLQYVFQGLSLVAYNTYMPCTSAHYAPDRSNQLKGIIRDYFQNDYPKELKLETDVANISDADIENDVLSLINMYPDNSFSGRNVARIFHGIPSPNFPAVIWGRCKYWRAHSNVDFNRILKLANAVIVRRRM